MVNVGDLWIETSSNWIVVALSAAFCISVDENISSDLFGFSLN